MQAEKNSSSCGRLSTKNLAMLQLVYEQQKMDLFSSFLEEEVVREGRQTWKDWEVSEIRVHDVRF